MGLAQRDVTGRAPVMSLAALLLVGLAALTGCGAPGAQRPPPPPSTAPSTQDTAGGLSSHLDSGSGLPNPGDCMDSKTFRRQNCVQPHDAEITQVGQLGNDLPASFPDEQTLLRSTWPPCRQSLAQYVGSQDGDATRLQAWAFWPNRDSWQAGARWLLCAVTELGPDGNPVTRTGSVRGALAGAGFQNFQVCTADPPSQEQQLRTVPCDQPHRGEALPDVLMLGSSTDPPPSQAQMNTRAKEHCTQSLNQYLGETNKRGDVSLTWRMPGPQDWAKGYTDVTCYAEVSRPISERLQDIGTGPLPR